MFTTFVRVRRINSASKAGNEISSNTASTPGRCSRGRRRSQMYQVSWRARRASASGHLKSVLASRQVKMINLRSGGGMVDPRGSAGSGSRIGPGADQRHVLAKLPDGLRQQQRCERHGDCPEPECLPEQSDGNGNPPHR
jgi:hypothetical protein